MPYMDSMVPAFCIPGCICCDATVCWGFQNPLVLRPSNDDKAGLSTWTQMAHQLILPDPKAKTLCHVVFLPREFSPSTTGCTRDNIKLQHWTGFRIFGVYRHLSRASATYSMTKWFLQVGIARIWFLFGTKHQRMNSSAILSWESWQI